MGLFLLHLKEEAAQQTRAEQSSTITAVLGPQVDTAGGETPQERRAGGGDHTSES